MDIFETTYQVNIELSNICNYSYMHKKCPAHRVKNKFIMPARIVYDILDTLGKYNYGAGKSISFYLYSDSLNDPRLFKFLEYARDKCPEANIIVGTNGWYLDGVLAKELYESGATYLLVTAYTKKEYERLLKVRQIVIETIDEKYLDKVSFELRKTIQLDSRMSMEGIEGPCYAPLSDLLICPDGRLRLCYLDVYRQELFGDLNKESFEKVIKDNYDRLSKLRDKLIWNERELALCKNCGRINAWKEAYRTGKDSRNEKHKLRRFAGGILIVPTYMKIDGKVCSYDTEVAI